MTIEKYSKCFYYYPKLKKKTRKNNPKNNKEYTFSDSEFKIYYFLYKNVRQMFVRMLH